MPQFFLVPRNHTLIGEFLGFVGFFYFKREESSKHQVSTKEVTEHLDTTFRVYINKKIRQFNFFLNRRNNSVLAL